MGRNTRETGPAQVLTERFPHANEHTAQFGDRSSLTTRPRLQNYRGTTAALPLTLSFM